MAGVENVPSSNFEPSPLQRIGICEAGHQFMFFCSNCNSAFCGNCWVRKHKDELRSHEVLELNDVMVQNTDKIAKSIRSLKEFSGTVDAMIKKETRKTHEKEEEFVTFCAEVQRYLMNETRERYLHRLQASRREIATAIREDNFEMPYDILNAIVTQLAQLERLQAINETTRLTLDEKGQGIDISEAVEKALAAIKQNKSKKALVNDPQPLPRAPSPSSYDPRARRYEVGGSRFSGQNAGASPVPNSQLNGGRGSTSVPSTTTGPASSTASSAPTFSGASGKQSCPICMDDDIPAAKWNRFNCGHGVCSDCQPGLYANDYKCPMCKAPFKKAQGTQPNGTMNDRVDFNLRIPGFEKDPNCRGAIIINYNFPSGKQGPEHPHPGSYYTGTARTCYLPNNPTGKKVLRLLKRAFDARLVFTIGKSVTTGADDCVIWNNIHHKTGISGGSTAFGYPDETYLARVTDELKDFGITE